MLDWVRTFLDKGDAAGAQAALGDVLRDFCTEEFARAGLRHPLLGQKSATLRKELLGLVPRLTTSPGRARAVIHALKADDLDRINFALAVILPDVALVMEEALGNARFKLGAAASNVEDPLSGIMRSSLVSPEITLLVTAAEEGMRLFDGSKLDRLEGGTLENLDVPEPDEPLITTLIDEDLLIQCPDCDDELRAPIASFGEDVSCACGKALAVPRPSLARMADYLKAKRDTLRGIGRCRICSGVIQTGGDVFMRAGFCTALCGTQARDRFAEHVAREGRLEGDEVTFRCFCGATMSAALADVGGKVACLSCPLEVWIPAPAPAREAPAARRSGPRTCGKCGKPVKPTARKCMYCGTPLSA